MKPLRRIAIVNRGEAGMRLIRAVRELEARDPIGRRTIALVTRPDRDSLYAREADERYDLGSPTYVDESSGRAKLRYLDYEALERSLRDTRADAAWVGWGLVSEHARFAELCRQLGVVFVGPDPEVMRRLGDKIGSKRLAEQAGVPVAPWSGGPVPDLEAARDHAARLGYPLMIKATAGGGGRGIRRVRAASELADAFEAARSEALGGFGDATVFFETLLESARHVEVQILADGQGTTWALGVRDCSIQRRNQKVLEETPSPALDAEQQRTLCEAAVRLVEAAGYCNAGTVEFLYDPSERRFSFMEVNARLQVEHPVTEATTGLDIVKLQLHIAAGGLLSGPPPAQRGHAIEVRLNAEDPERGFAPAPGRVDLFRQPTGAGVRVDSGVAEGDDIALEFDSMIAKIVAVGSDRAEALARLERALGETRVAVRGGASNKGFLLGLLRHPAVRSGEADNAWLDALTARGAHQPEPDAAAGLVAAAIDAYEDDFAVERARFVATAARGRPQSSAEVGRSLELRARGQTYALQVHRLGPGAYRVALDGTSLRARVEPLGPLECRLHLPGRSVRSVSLRRGVERVVEVDGLPIRFADDAGGVVRSPSPAVVLSFAVEPGDEVRAGDPIAVLEAMKTELQVVAPCAGKVRALLATTHTQVDAGAPLVALEIVREAGGRVSENRIGLASEEEAPAADARQRACTALGDLERLMLGYDVDSSEMRRLLDLWRASCDELPAEDAQLAAREDAVLAAFTDVCALFRGRTAPEGEESESSEEYLHSFLRSPGSAVAGIPESFLARLRETLLHYGVRDLARSEALEESLLWICKAHARLDEQVGVVLALLERRLEQPQRLAAHEGESHRELLDRIIDSTRSRHPAVSDLAREVRYRSVDRPLFEEIRRRAYAEAEQHLAALASDADPEPHLRALVSCPQPLVNLLSARFEAAVEPLRERMLEALTRRYYRIRQLEELESFSAEGRSLVRAAYEHEGRRIRVLATCARWAELAEAIRVLSDLARRIPEHEDVMLDLYLWQPGPHAAADAVVRALQEGVEGADLRRPIRRVVAAVGAPGYGPGLSSMQHFTLRPRPEGGFAEERVYRGIHPMMAKRLQLWRTANFEIERLPSTEDVYLFRGKARSNPKDERLFAFTEVRDLTPVRDASGRVVRLPTLEMMLMETLATIRRFQSTRSTRQRLHWNRVLLYVWPPLDLDEAQLQEQIRRLAPATADLGIEKVVLRVQIPDPQTGELPVKILQVSNPTGRGVEVVVGDPAQEPIRPLSSYGQKVVRMRQRGLVYPYELAKLLAPPRERAQSGFPPGEFEEYDLDAEGRLAPVDRPPGQNTANMVVGTLTSFTPRIPEGMTRVLLLGDPSRDMGSFAEPECRRLIAALDLAEARGVPLEWVAVSAGARIAMDSGTENLDWTAAALRRLIEFTQSGGEVNVIVAGVNVGGQSYWNAEATMLMHTRGVLIMTPGASMVLTGKRALDYSGGVSAEDNEGIGGYDRVMGGNGQAQYWAADVAEACQLLLRYYEHSYVVPGERFPRPARTSDPRQRDVRASAHGGEFERVGDVFSDSHNPGRRKPFDIRRVMEAVIDSDHRPLERWRDMFEAEIAVVWDAHLGGHPVTLIGFDSKPIRRRGPVPTDGPESWTAGTLFPLSSKKVARAINAASGNRPVVLVANLSGFDGSPESMRRLQLEYGAEIGRAVVNFRGPIVFCVISRYHGGAYVVFSRTLNENLEVAALEGSFASVIGGAPAAAVVFAREVERRTRADEELVALDSEIAAVPEAERGRLRSRWHARYEEIHSQKLGEVAAEFESVHDVARAKAVGSLHEIVAPETLRPYLIEAVERGMQRELERWRGASAAPQA